MGTDKMHGKLQKIINSSDLQNQVFIRKPVNSKDVLHYIASADIGVTHDLYQWLLKAISTLLL